MDKRYVRILAVAASAAISMGTLAACGSDDDDSGSTTSSGGAAATGTTSGGGARSGKIALLLPENKTARYESQDRPLFEAKIRELCPDCEVIYSNAEQDASQQQQQAEAAITNGARVLVLDPVDGRAAAAIATRAKQSDIGVIAYDRSIENADIDYYISFDNARVGELQAQALVDKLRRDGRSGDIVMINGAPTDPNAALFKEARTASSTPPRGSESARSTTRPTGRRTERRRRWSRRSPRSAETTSSASTPPTTAPPAARSPR